MLNIWRENAGGKLLRNASFFDVQEQERTGRGDGIAQVVADHTRTSEQNSFPLLFAAGEAPVGSDDERLVRKMQPVEPAPHCEHLLLQQRGSQRAGKGAGCTGLRGWVVAANGLKGNSPCVRLR